MACPDNRPNRSASRPVWDHQPRIGQHRRGIDLGGLGEVARLLSGQEGDDIVDLVADKSACDIGGRRLPAAVTFADVFLVRVAQLSIRISSWM